MDLILTRKQSRSDGIFSQLTDINGNFVCETLEHAYRDQDGYFAKLPVGLFHCVRGKHELHRMTHKFETFEITGVPGHSDILFHWGNFNQDSSGCVLVGTLMANDSGLQMVSHSVETFRRFMDIQDGVDSFQLTVVAG